MGFAVLLSSVFMDVASLGDLFHIAFPYDDSLILSTLAVAGYKLKSPHL